MTAQINFYQTDDAVIKSIIPLLSKVLSEKENALIYCKNQEKAKEIDKLLWSYDKNKFIPHSLDSDKDFDAKRQPILITNEENNQNEARYLIFIDEPTTDFVNSFKRVFHFFEEGNCNSKLKPQNFYKKSGGKWVKS